MIIALLLVIASANAAVTGLSPSSATVYHERNGYPGSSVAVQVQGTGAFTVSSGTCYSWQASATSGTAPATIYLRNYTTADGLTVGDTGTCAIDVGGQTFTFTWHIVAGAFPPIYATNPNKIADSALTSCSKYAVGDDYAGVCTSPSVRPSGWPTTPGGTFTDPIFGGVLTRMTAANISHTYGVFAMVSSDNLYALNLDIVSGSNGLIYDIASHTQLFSPTFATNSQSCQWSANPSTPRVIFCDTGAAIRKYTVTGTPPSGMTDNGDIYTNVAGLYTTTRFRFSSDDTVPYFDSTAFNAVGATQLCAINLNTQSLKTCYTLSNLPSPQPTNWRGLAISPGKDVEGFRYIMAATGQGEGGVRLWKYKDGDSVLTLVSNGVPAWDGIGSNAGLTWSESTCEGGYCVAGGHFGMGVNGSHQILYSPDPVRNNPSYRIARALMRLDYGSAASLTVPASRGGYLTFGSQSVDYVSCSPIVPICVTAGSLHQSTTKPSSKITAITTANPFAVTIESNNICTVTGVTTGNPYTVTVSGACALTFAVGQSVYLEGVGGISGVNGTRVIATVPTSTTFTVASASTGTYTSGGLLSYFHPGQSILIAGAGGISGVNGVRTINTVSASTSSFTVATASTGTYTSLGVVTSDAAWSMEDEAGNEVVAHRLDTGHIRRLTKTWGVPFSSTYYGSSGYWDATRVTVSPDGKTVMFGANGGVPDDIADFTVSTGFDIIASTPPNQFDKNGHGYTLSVGMASATANITTSSSQSCTFSVSVNSDLSGATTASGTINTTGTLTISSLVAGTHYYSRVVCDENNVAVAEFTPAPGVGKFAGSMSGSMN